MRARFSAACASQMEYRPPVQERAVETQQEVEAGTGKQRGLPTIPPFVPPRYPANWSLYKGNGE